MAGSICPSCKLLSFRWGSTASWFVKFCARAALLRAWLGLRFVICEVSLTGTRALFSEERACKTALGIDWLVDLKIESTHWKWLLLFAQ